MAATRVRIRARSRGISHPGTVRTSRSWCGTERSSTSGYDGAIQDDSRPIRWRCTSCVEPRCTCRRLSVSWSRATSTRSGPTWDGSADALRVGRCSTGHHQNLREVKEEPSSTPLRRERFGGAWRRRLEPSLQLGFHRVAHGLQSRPRLEIACLPERFGRVDLEAGILKESQPRSRGVRPDVARISVFFEIIDELRGRAVLGNEVVDHGGDSAGLEHARHLADESGAIGEMMRRHAAGDELELPILKGQGAGVGFTEAHVRDALAAYEPLRGIEHLLREVGRNDLAHARGEGKRGVAAPGGDIEYAPVPFGIDQLEHPVEAFAFRMVGARYVAFGVQAELPFDEIVEIGQPVTSSSRRGDAPPSGGDDDLPLPRQCDPGPLQPPLGLGDPVLTGDPGDRVSPLPAG